MGYGQESPEKERYIEETTVARDPDYGHVQEMLVALDENSTALAKAVEGLSERLRPVLKESSPEDSENAVPAKPVRCPVADDLARVNDRIYELRGWVNRLQSRVDV